MILPPDFEHRLGFDQIRDRLTAYCLGELGKKKVFSISLLSSHSEILTLLILNEETRDLLEKGEDFPIGPYKDPTLWFDVIVVEGSYLEADDLFALARAFQMILSANAFLTADPESRPQLCKLALPSSTGKKIVSTFRSKLDDEGKVRDNASADLGRIRKKLREEELKARRMAELIMRQALEKGWSPEGSNPTIRDGRMVIPLAAEHKRKIKGYLIDQSSTGQTVFVEPADVMEANNDLRDLALDERKEVVRILKEMTGFIRENLDEVRSGYELLGSLDFHRAKARFSRDLHAVRPEVKDSPTIRWSSARHPLLFLTLRNRRPLVPLTISLTETDRFLLVSGPNAGGKSVCLKTVGLIQYMAQCGLLVPMDADSEIGVFESIFLGIGDQQSIESDLSTYSSHLKNMAQFIAASNDRTLILMDELGSGTDPNFGGGIAQAILEELLKKKTWGLATTHYYNLKVFASHFTGIRNASMQFDSEKLVPLFQLEIGQPGSSFALEIARKTGLQEETLEAADRIIGKELIGLETLIKQVAEEKVRIGEREKEVSAREQELLKVQLAYNELKTKLESQKKDIINSAKTEAATLLQETNREIERTIRHIRENKAEKQETRKVRQGLRQLAVKVKTVAAPINPQGPMKEGDKVRMTGGEVTGTVLSVKGGKAVVLFGNLRSTVKTERLVRSDQADQPSPKSQSPQRGFSGSPSEFTSMLDIRGMRVDAVMSLLTRFMDDALQFGMPEVRILHGKGEGVLRKVVRDYLKTLKSVSAFHDEHADRGGDGITCVELA